MKVLNVYFHIMKVNNRHDEIRNTVLVTVDLQIQGHELFLRDLFYLWLKSCYRRDPGVYFHIIGVKNHNGDVINTVRLTVDP